MRWILGALKEERLWRRVIWREEKRLFSRASSSDPTDTYALMIRGAHSAAEIRSTHHRILQDGYGGNRFVCNTLIQAYARHRSVEDSRRVFEYIRSRNAFSFTAMIDAFVINEQYRDALELYNRMVEEGVKPDGFVFTGLLSACSGSGDLEEGKAIHARIIGAQIPLHIIVQNALLNMYIKCGSLEDAQKLFDNMPKRDVVSWTTLISAYAQSRHNKEALELYYKMERDGAKPDKYLFSTILAACSSLEELQAIHTCIVCHSDIDIIVEIGLVNAYVKFGSMDEARKVFDEIQKKNKALAPWSTMISGYAQAGHIPKAMELFDEIDFEPDVATWTVVLGALGNTGNLQEGRRAHERLRRLGGNVVVETALVNMYVKCGSMDEAREVFHSMSTKNVYSWSVMISGCSQHELMDEAVELYHGMLLEGLKSNSFTYVGVLAACKTLSYGKLIHVHVSAINFMSDNVVLNSLMNMYSRLGALHEARKVFDSMESRNVVLWTSMISAYVQHEKPDEALELFMKMDVEPDLLTYTSILGACLDIDQVRRIHVCVTNKVFAADFVLRKCLVNTYCKFGAMDEARMVLEQMEKRDITVWSSIISAYAHRHLHESVLEAFEKVVYSEELEPTSFMIGSALTACANLGAVERGRQICTRFASKISEESVQPAVLNMYVKLGLMDEAEEAFKMIDCPSVVTWTALMAGYVQHGRAADAIELFKKMEGQGIEPDSVCYAIVLGACSLSGSLTEGRQIHQQIVKQHVLDVIVGTALVNMYGKCGNFEDVESVFLDMKEKNVFTWTSVLAAYAQQGQGHKAVEICREMDLQGVSPDSVTLISVLVACSRTGLIEEARQYFQSIEMDRRLDYLVDHYLCMVDLLGRAGWLEDAQELIQVMPFEASPNAWRTLLGGCKLHSDLGYGENAAKRVLELKPDDPSAQVLLSSIYSLG